MTTKFITALRPTAEYLKKYRHSENWQTIEALAALLNTDADQSNIVTSLEDFTAEFDSLDEEKIACMLILDPRGVGTEFTVDEINKIITMLRNANPGNAFIIALTDVFTHIDDNTKQIFDLADFMVFLRINDYHTTEHLLKETQESIVIAPPSLVEIDTTLFGFREHNILVNGDVLYEHAVNNICDLANALKENLFAQKLLCFIEVPFQHDVTALATLLKRIYPNLSDSLNTKLARDPELKARELVAWYDDQANSLIGEPALPIELNFNRQTKMPNVLSICAYAYDPTRTDLSNPSCRLNDLLANELLILVGDPIATAQRIINFEKDQTAFLTEAHKQMNEHKDKYCNAKILNEILRFTDDFIEKAKSSLQEQYPNVNSDYSYDEDFFWQVILTKAASLNLHLEDEKYGGLILSHSGTAFVKDDTNFSITGPLLIGGQDAAIKLSIDGFKQAISKGLTEKHSIITPLFKKGLEHWCLALIEVTAETANLTIFETIRNDSTFEVRRLVQAALPEKIRLLESKTTFVRSQKDGVSCGPLAIKHLFEVLSPHNGPATDSTSYSLLEIYALRDEHLKLLDDPALTQRQKTNAPPAAEPQKPRMNFDLFGAIQYLRALIAKLQDNTTELDHLYTLCQQFMLSEQPDTFDCSNAKSDLKTWFASNAERLDCLPLFNIFFEYPKSTTDNNEPRWKDGSVDNLVVLLRIVNIRDQRASKVMRFSKVFEESSSDCEEKQRPGSRQEFTFGS